jgi:NitT/TauT family transport system substrate-binding protein
MMHKGIRCIFLKSSLTAFVVVLLPAVAAARSGQTIHFGTLPVVQSLPLFVAAEKGFFRERGLSVDLVLFNSATEKDVALTSGQIAGYFGDIMTPMVLNANGIPAKMVVTLFSTPPSQPMFAIMAGPKSRDKSLAGLAKTGLAGSSNTIIEYITLKILESRNLSGSQLNMIEVKNISIRLQMLLTDQVPGAILPEPLVSHAKTKGALVVADDAGKGISATVLVFTDPFLKEHPKVVRTFLEAVSQAAAFINKNAAEVRPIMNQHCRIPDPLHQTFAIPPFSKLTLPEPDQVMDVYRWLRSKGIVQKEMNYRQMVADGYLP